MPPSKAKAPTNRSERPRLSLEEVRSELRKKYGDEIIVLGSELKGRVVQRVTTGSLALDMVLGGGWPLNRWNEIIERAFLKGDKIGLSKEFITKYFDAVHMESINHQKKIMDS